MAVILSPYLSFRDEARQALELYHSVFGGTLHLTTFREALADADGAEGDKILHGRVDGEHGIVLMAADTPATMPYEHGGNVSLSLSGEDGAVLRGWWEALLEGGTVVEQLTTAPWGDSFGMCTDRFGVRWLVNITAEAA